LTPHRRRGRWPGTCNALRSGNDRHATDNGYEDDMILPIPMPTRSNRKIKPRWDRYYDEPVPGDYWGRGPGDEDGAREQDPAEEPQRIH